MRKHFSFFLDLNTREVSTLGKAIAINRISVMTLAKNVQLPELKNFKESSNSRANTECAMNSRSLIDNACQILWILPLTNNPWNIQIIRNHPYTNIDIYAKDFAPLCNEELKAKENISSLDRENLREDQHVLVPFD